MTRFGEIADELTELIEDLGRAPMAQDSEPLRAALQRAFVQACLAERTVRRRSERIEQTEPTG
jgi:hypothetical protein